MNRRTIRYPLHYAEKDYMLALVLQAIMESSIGKKLVFKGGTAIHHCYLEQFRFSEDLDFSSVERTFTSDQVGEVLSGIEFLEIKKPCYCSDATIKFSRLGYLGPLEYPNSIKVEIDIKQKVLLPVQVLPYHTAWGFEFPVRVMDAREICAEKIRAMSDRARYRDFYDLYLMTEKFMPDLKKICEYIRQKEIRQLISKRSILKNWEIAVSGKELDQSNIYYSRAVGDRMIEELIDNLPFEEISNA